MFADLHIHTHYSDSTRSPAEVVTSVKQQGFELLSVCDHDNISAYAELIPLCKAEGVSLIVGTEIHTLYEGKEYHILGYGFDLACTELNALLNYSSGILVDRGYQLIEKMSADYKELSLVEFKLYKRNVKNGGWPSIDYLITKGLAQRLDEYSDFCSRYQVVDKNRFRSISEVTEIIHNAGGKAVLAHAGEMIDNSPKIFCAMLPKLLSQGIDGFECYYTSHTPEITNMLVDFCINHGLLITAGSDDHGGFNNEIDGVEYFIGAVKVDTEKLNLKGLVSNGTNIPSAGTQAGGAGLHSGAY